MTKIHANRLFLVTRVVFGLLFSAPLFAGGAEEGGGDDDVD